MVNDTMTLPWLLKENGNNNKENIVKKTKYTENMREKYDH
jgi:hypothetical protein